MIGLSTAMLRNFVITNCRSQGAAVCAFPLAASSEACSDKAVSPFVGSAMSFDLIIRNAELPDGRSGQDIAVAGGKIAAVEAGIAAEAGEIIDAAGHLVVPPFVDCHFHMDATLSLGLP